MTTCLHIIVAAGTGSRFGAPLPKQFCLLDGRPVIWHTIEAVRSSIREGDAIVLAISDAMAPLVNRLAAEHRFDNIMIVGAGGPTRAATVANALAATSDIVTDLVSIHDGARPLVGAPLIGRLTEAASRPGSVGAIPAVELSDSIRRLTPEGGSAAVARSDYRAVQTPQVFPSALLREAYDGADVMSPLLTDDASVVEAFTGRPPMLVEGDPDNFKITHPADIARARALLALRSHPRQ